MLNLSATDLQIAIENETFVDKVRNDFMGGVRSGVNGNRHDGCFDYENLLIALEQVEK